MFESGINSIQGGEALRKMGFNSFLPACCGVNGPSISDEKKESYYVIVPWLPSVTLDTCNVILIT